MKTLLLMKPTFKNFSYKILSNLNVTKDLLKSACDAMMQRAVELKGQDGLVEPVGDARHEEDKYVAMIKAARESQSCPQRRERCSNSP